MLSFPYGALYLPLLLVISLAYHLYTGHPASSGRSHAPCSALDVTGKYTLSSVASATLLHSLLWLNNVAVDRLSMTVPSMVRVHFGSSAEGQCFSRKYSAGKPRPAALR